MSKHPIAGIVTVLALSLLLAGWQQIGSQQQDSNTKQEGHMKTVRSEAPLKWQNVEAGQVVRLWQLEGPTAYPQVSVMRVSNSQYLKFSQNPRAFMEFVNQKKVFSKAVIEAGPWVTLSSVDQQGAPLEWVLTLLHGKRSTLIVAALPELKQEEANSK